MEKKDKPKIEPIEVKWNFTVEFCNPVKDQMKKLDICSPHVMVKPCEPLKKLAKECEPIPICLPVVR